MTHADDPTRTRHTPAATARQRTGTLARPTAHPVGAVATNLALTGQSPPPILSSQRSVIGPSPEHPIATHSGSGPNVVATVQSPVRAGWASQSPLDRGEEVGSAMIPGQFDYVRPADLDETLRILKDREGEAKLLSGGYSLIPLIKLRLAQPALLVDLRDVTGLDGILETDDELVIGAKATHRQIHENPIVVDHYPGLVDLTGRDRRSAGPQLGHDRRLGRPRRPGQRLAGHAPGDERQPALPQPVRGAADQRPRLLPRHLHRRPSSRPRS